MSHSSPSLPRRKYGAVQVVEQDASAAAKPRQQATATGQRRHGRRWRGLAAVALGAAVVGLAFNRQPQTTATQPSNEDAVSFIDVDAPKVQTSSAPPTPRASSPTPPAAAAAATDGLAPLSFTALNYYHTRDGKPGVGYPWLENVKLIEPHRETTLSVSSPRDGYEYLWEVRGGDPERADLRATASGAEAVVILTTLDDNMVTLKELTSDGEVVRQLDEMVMVKYVRREIRTLTDDERDELMDAVSACCGWGSTGRSPLPYSGNRDRSRVCGRMHQAGVWVPIYYCCTPKHKNVTCVHLYQTWHEKGCRCTVFDP